MGKEDFLDKTFTAPPERRRQTIAFILRYVDPQQSCRVLDLGCGTGEQLVDLAKELPNAHLTGVDVAEMNIERAREHTRGKPVEERLSFVVADYLHFETTPFNLIISDSTLQNIDSPTETLFSKIDSDLLPGGSLVATIPYICIYNQILWLVRRVFRLLHSPWTDSLLLTVAKLLHGRQYSEPSLRQRLHYMYQLPHLYDSKAFRQLLEATWGLNLVGEDQVPHQSLAQPKHRMLVWRKRMGA
jgi:trans-aconitate methyltransferase